MCTRRRSSSTNSLHVRRSEEDTQWPPILHGKKPSPYVSRLTQELSHDTTFREFLQGYHALSQDIRILYQAMVGPRTHQTVPVATAAAPRLDAAAFGHAAVNERRDWQTEQLLSLTEPEMGLLVTARHFQLREKEPFTFEMCLHELRQFVQRVQRTNRGSTSAPSVALAGLDALAQRPPVLAAFYQLLHLDLLVPEASRVSLILPAGAAARTGPATNAYGVYASTAVVPEFSPVCSTVSGSALLKTLTDPRRREPLRSVLVQWAESTGI